MLSVPVESFAIAFLSLISAKLLKSGIECLGSTPLHTLGTRVRRIKGGVVEVVMWLFRSSLHTTILAYLLNCTSHYQPRG